MSEKNLEQWSNGDNWLSIFGQRVIYSAPADSRILVPKQPLVIAFGDVHLELSLGWTFNMTHTESKVMMALLLTAIPAVAACFRKGRQQ